MEKKKQKTTVKEIKDIIPDITKIEQLCEKNSALIHASNIRTKAIDCANDEDSHNKIEKLNILIPQYLAYVREQNKISLGKNNCTSDDLYKTLKNTIDSNIKKRVKLLNQYYQFFEENKIESKQGFDSRSKIRSTILEEFMYFLFKDFVNILLKESGMKKNVIKNGSIDAYSNLYFTASDIKKFIQVPSIEINSKRQDYAIYREVDISIKNAMKSKQTANIPLLAIENKTFLDKTMLEGAISTAEKIKMGAPYSIYIVATETYAVKFEVDPVYSRIDQIFVLRKCRQNKNNRLPQPINEDVVKSMFWYVVQKLLRPWSAIEKKLSESGTII